MNHFMERMKKRFLKYIWLLVLLPVFTGAAGYLIEARQSPAYTATQTISLGSYEDKANEQFTNPSTAKQIILSPSFLDQLHLKMSAKNIKRDLLVKGESPNIVVLSLKGSTEKTVKSTLSTIVKNYMTEDKQKYKKKINLMNKEIQHLKNSQVDPQNVYEKEKFLYQLRLDQLNMKQPAVVNQLSITKQSGNPEHRAVIGFLVGLVLSLFLLLIPEFLIENQ